MYEAMGFPAVVMGFFIAWLCAMAYMYCIYVITSRFNTNSLMTDAITVYSALPITHKHTK